MREVLLQVPRVAGMVFHPSKGSPSRQRAGPLTYPSTTRWHRALTASHTPPFHWHLCTNPGTSHTPRESVFSAVLKESQARRGGEGEESQAR